MNFRLPVPAVSKDRFETLVAHEGEQFEGGATGSVGSTLKLTDVVCRNIKGTREDGLANPSFLAQPDDVGSVQIFDGCQASYIEVAHGRFVDQPQTMHPTDALVHGFSDFAPVLRLGEVKFWSDRSWMLGLRKWARRQPTSNKSR